MRKVDWIAEHGGMVLLDTHPDYMAFAGSQPKSTQYDVAFYREFLSYVRTRYAGDYWHALPREVARHVTGLRSSQASSTEADAPSAADLSLLGKRAAVLLFSHFPADPRPRRAAEAMAAEGATVDFICLRNHADDAAQESYGGINVTRVPLRRQRGGKLGYVGQYSAFLLTCFLYLASRSLKRRYDVVHVHNMPDVLVFSALVPKMLGAKVILDLHDPMPELMQTIFKLPEHSLSVRLLKRLEKWSIRVADLVLTVNLACKKIYGGRSCPPEKIKVVINSPDDEIFRFQPAPSYQQNGSNGQQAKPFAILYHGSLVHRNGFDLAVTSLEKVREEHPDVRLNVCGARTEFFDRVMESAEERGLTDAIDYLGVRGVHGVVKAIEECALGIIPNHRNIFTELNTPTRIFEYLALGKPVIAPRAQGIQDYFGPDDLIFFELGNADDLAAKIAWVRTHPAEVAEIVQRGQRVYLEHTWTLEKCGFLQAVKDLL
ncbi:MAG: glycosyltransferase family 4 protein [Chthoniobacterales bacterium]|nr:glycosyltransferase family 4 protein [Chthoniobacterales bacterium]